MQRRERLTERRKLHQLKRDHEKQESSRRKVLRMDEGQDGEFSSGSDAEGAGKGKKDKEGSGQDVDIQVTWKKGCYQATPMPNTQLETLSTHFFCAILWYIYDSLSRIKSNV